MGKSGCWRAALREADRIAARRSEYPTFSMTPVI